MKKEKIKELKYNDKLSIMWFKKSGLSKEKIDNYQVTGSYQKNHSLEPQFIKYGANLNMVIRRVKNQKLLKNLTSKEEFLIGFATIDKREILVYGNNLDVWYNLSCNDLFINKKGMKC